MSTMLSDIVLSIERDVNSNKHKKDPFLPRYVDLTTSEYQQKESDLNFDTLSRNLKVRTSLITAQLSALCKELDVVGSEAKGPSGDTNSGAKTKSTKHVATTATLAKDTIGVAELSQIADDVAELMSSRLEGQDESETQEHKDADLRHSSSGCNSWFGHVARAAHSANVPAYTPFASYRHTDLDMADGDKVVSQSALLSGVMKSLDMEVTLLVADIDSDPTSCLDHVASACSYRKYLKLIKPFSFAPTDEEELDWSQSCYGRNVDANTVFNDVEISVVQNTMSDCASAQMEIDESDGYFIRSQDQECDLDRYQDENQDDSECHQNGEHVDPMQHITNADVTNNTSCCSVGIIHAHSNSLADRLSTRMPDTVDVGAIAVVTSGNRRVDTGRVRYNPLDMAESHSSSDNVDEHNGPDSDLEEAMPTVISSSDDITTTGSSSIIGVGAHARASVSGKPPKGVRASSKRTEHSTTATPSGDNNAVPSLPPEYSRFLPLDRLRQIHAYCSGLSLACSHGNTSSGKKARSTKQSSHVVVDAGTLLFNTSPASVAQLVEMSGVAYLFHDFQSQQQHQNQAQSRWSIATDGSTHMDMAADTDSSVHKSAAPFSTASRITSTAQAIQHILTSAPLHLRTRSPGTPTTCMSPTLDVSLAGGNMTDSDSSGAQFDHVINPARGSSFPHYRSHGDLFVDEDGQFRVLHEEEEDEEQEQKGEGKAWQGQWEDRKLDSDHRDYDYGNGDYDDVDSYNCGSDGQWEEEQIKDEDLRYTNCDNSSSASCIGVAAQLLLTSCKQACSAISVITTSSRSGFRLPSRTAPRPTVSLSLVQMQQMIQKQLALRPAPSASTLNLEMIVGQYQQEPSLSHHCCSNSRPPLSVPTRDFDPRSYYYFQDLEQQDVFRLHEFEFQQGHVGDCRSNIGEVGDLVEVEIARQFHAKRGFMALLYLADTYNKLSAEKQQQADPALRARTCQYQMTLYSGRYNSNEPFEDQGGLSSKVNSSTDDVGYQQQAPQEVCVRVSYSTVNTNDNRRMGIQNRKFRR